MTIFNKRERIKDLHFRLYEEDLEAIKEEAKRQSLPLVTLIRKVLLDYIRTKKDHE
jgi:predicted DNA binding CopG/RHH family protein